MAAIDKAIELLEKVLEENYKLSECYEIKPETRDEIEGWLKWYNDLQKRADGVSPNENSGLTIPVVVQQRELLFAYEKEMHELENDVSIYIRVDSYLTHYSKL
jgi:hypothetical protein